MLKTVQLPDALRIAALAYLGAATCAEDAAPDKARRYAAQGLALCGPMEADPACMPPKELAALRKEFERLARERKPACSAAFSGAEIFARIKSVKKEEIMSLIIAYALTIVGLIFAGVHDFAGMGIFLTAIGVVITLVHGLRAKYKPVALIAALAVHAALWIVPNFSPELVGKLIGAAIGIPIAAAPCHRRIAAAGAEHVRQ